MPKAAAVRIQDTLREVTRILGPDAVHHLMGKLGAPGGALFLQLSADISLARTVRRGSARRHAIRAYAMLLIVLENRAQVFVRARIQDIETANEPLGFIENRCRAVWRGYDRTVDIDALRTQTQELRTHPLQLLRAHPVLPCDGSIRQDVTGDYDLITLNGAAPNPTTVRMVLTPSGANEFAFRLTYAPTSKQNHGVPTYFLPWKSARIIRMTLPLGAGPALFFTAAINGCSVFVEGPMTSPTVYHAGITPPWPVMGVNCNAHVTLAKVAGNIPLTWRELFWQHALHSPRGGNTFGEANKTAYITDGTVSAAGIPTTALADAYDQQIRLAWAAPPHNLNVTSCLPWGCVFGVRSFNAWNFYLQQNVTLLFTDNAGGNWATSRLLRLSRFFPVLAANNHTPAGHLTAPVPAVSNTVYRR
jgi:hypothetical protein